MGKITASHRLARLGGKGIRMARLTFGAPVLPERFWLKVRRAAGDCWMWTASTNSGYGQFGMWKEGRVVLRAHRVAFKAAGGVMVPGMTLDHLCRNRACCNPMHLEQVSRAENVMRGIGPAAMNARKTHCKNGHPFNDENTSHIVAASGNPGRDCRVCHRDRERARYRRRHGI